MINMMKKIFLYLIDGVRKKKINRNIKNILSTEKISFIDIGAAGNIHPRWKKISRNLNYYGFEPDLRSYELLVDKKNECNEYKIFNTAIWENESEIEINLCKKPWVSSFYKPNYDFLNNFPESDRFTIIKNEKIKTNSLDNIKLRDKDFIKIDIQGGELNVIKGAPKTLQECLGLEVEVEFLEIYKSQPLFGELCIFLKKQGFEFIDFISLNRWERTKYDGYGQSTFGDALFMRTPEYIQEIFSKEPNKLRKYIATCALYNRFDYIETTINSKKIKEKFTFDELKIIKNSTNQMKYRHKKIRLFNKFFNKILRIIDDDNRLHLFY